MIITDNEMELPTVGSKVYVEITVIRHPNSFSVNLPYGNVDLAKVTISVSPLHNALQYILESWAV